MAPLLTHPNSWVRHAAVDFFSSVGHQFSPTETYCLLRPVLKSFLARPLISLESSVLLAALKPSASRLAFDLALACAAEQQQQHSQLVALAAAAAANAPAGATALADGQDANTAQRLGFDSAEDVAAFEGMPETFLDEGVALGADSDLRGIEAPDAPGMALAASLPHAPPLAPAAGAAACGGEAGAPATAGSFVAAPVALSEMALDLRSISSLGADEEAVLQASRPLLSTSLGLPSTHPPLARGLQAMREYIRAASLQKMAKIRMWETENLALLQMAGGGGGGELVQFRTLSQHIKVHRLAPQPPPPPLPARGSQSSLGLGSSKKLAATAPSGVSPLKEFVKGATGAGGGAAGDGGGCGGAAASIGADGQRTAARRPSGVLGSARAKANVALFGRPRNSSTNLRAAANVALFATRASRDASRELERHWPIGQRLPSSWHACTQPGSLVAALRSHPEGVRQLVTSSDSQASPLSSLLPWPAPSPASLPWPPPSLGLL